MKRPKWVRGALVVGSVGAMVTTPSAVASAGGPPDTRVMVELGTSPLAAATDQEAVSSNAAACNWYTRTQVCQSVKVTINVLDNSRLVGSLHGTITQAIVFNTKSRTFRETMTFRTDRIVGKAGGIRENLAVVCGNPCRVTNDTFPRGQVLRAGATLRGRITYVDNVKKGGAHSTASQYTMTFVKPGYTPGVIRWRSIGYRCDNRFYFPEQRRRIPGCVIPRFAPTMTSMRKLHEISKNIRRVQTKGPGHYGRPGSGHPLHRLTNVTRQRKNRQAVCGRNIVGPPPRRNLECDEYPFASTYEGGTAVAPRDRGVAWVPSGEQRRQGGLISAFWRNQRVLDRDAFYVRV